MMSTCRAVAVSRPFRRWLMLLIAIVMLAISIAPLQAQETGNAVDGFPVVLNEQTLFYVRQGIPGVASAEERAAVITERLTELAANPEIAVDSIRLEEQDTSSVVKAGETVLFTVRDTDTGDRPRQEVAAETVATIKAAVAQYREDRNVRSLATGFLLASLSTIALLFFLRQVQFVASKLLLRIKAARRTDGLDIRVQQFQLIGSNVTSYLLTGIVKLLRLGLILGGLYLYVPFVLSQFPTTRPFGQRLLQNIANQVSQLAEGFAHYLPNLITIAIIAFLTYYAIGLAKLIIIELGRDDAYPWFYPEWIRPTIRLAIFLIIAVACVIAAPYLPGSNSPAFQGVSLFLGALFTLGSSSAIANAISGVILIYTRAFRLHDMIQIGDVFGAVDEKSLFVTRIITPKQELITIPNATILGSSVTNFSAILRKNDGHLLLHTTITLGYDVPWRTVHDVLIEAAKATIDVLLEPHPFVLQKSLNDFNVAYELNVFTDHPELMPLIYSELHQNIQDYCNQAGIEILSPSYAAVRDGNHSTIPSNYLPSSYTAPGFQISSQNHSTETKPDHAKEH
jgi:small-conductance mechanosensitive channel